MCQDMGLETWKYILYSVNICNMNPGKSKIVKRIGKVLLAVVGLVILAFVGLIIYARFFYSSDIDAESYYVESLPLANDRFNDDFNEIADVVKENYSLYESKHLNLDSLCDAYAVRVKGISTPKEYGEILQEFFAALRVGHASVYFKTYSAGAVPVIINDSIFISKPNTILTQAGFKDKDRVIAIDGVPTVEWMNCNEKYVASSTPLNRRMFTGGEMFRSLSDTVRTYTVCRGLDTLAIRLPLVPHEALPAVNSAATESKILNDSIGYLAINTMMDGVLESFASDFSRVRNLPYLIIDVRNNEGGNSGNGRELCRYFIRKDQPHCIGGENMSPMADAYTGKEVLLTGPKTFSAAESFVIDMKESGNVILIGESTAGDTGNRPKTFRTSNGICFRIPTAPPTASPKGFPLEGVGIEPDYRIVQTVTDFLNDTDTQLEFALRYII